MAALQQVLTDGMAALSAVNSGEVTLDDFLDNRLQFPERRRSSAFLLGTYFRHRNYLHGVLARYVVKEPGERVKSLLLLTLTLMFFSDALQPEKVANAAVDCTGKNTKGFLNAVLRRALADFKSQRLIEEASPDKVLPREIYRHWRNFLTSGELGAATELFLGTPPFTFRAQNTPLNELEMMELEALELSGFGDFHFYRSINPAKVIDSFMLKKGRIYIQDPATAIAPTLARCTNASTILDYCAAPGGKSLMMLEQLPPKSLLYAYEFAPARKKLLEENFRKSRITPERGVIINSPQEVGEVDLVLVDVPCSNSGVFRRRPDALWRWSSKELTKITLLQRQILNDAAQKVKTGGKMVYSTCSIDPVENEEQIKDFLATHPNWRLVEEKKIFPGKFNDGAYAALLQK